jgi:hypothetical protein
MSVVCYAARSFAIIPRHWNYKVLNQLGRLLPFQTEHGMNFKNLSVKDISQLVSTLSHPKDIEEAVHKLNDLIESFRILRSMLEGRKALQLQQEQLKRKKGCGW